MMPTRAPPQRNGAGGGYLVGNSRNHDSKRKGGAPPFASIGKAFFCFDIKSFLGTMFALTLVMMIWKPYYENLIIATSRCIPTTPSDQSLSLGSATSAVNNVASDKAAPEQNIVISSNEPINRTFRSYGSAADLFVLFGAYRGSPTTFAVIGLASKPIHVYSTPWFKCEWIPNNGSSPIPSVEAEKLLPDWGYGRIYTTVVVNCTFSENPNSDNSGGKLALYAYYSETSTRYEKMISMEEAPGSYDESIYSPPYKYEYLYCGSSLYGNLTGPRIREWMAYHTWFFGPKTHFVFHNAGGVTSEVRAALEPYIRLGRATLQDVQSQSQYDSYYYNQFVVVNDCLHRYRYAANWTFFFDVDEYIYIPEGNTLESILQEFSNVTQFTIDQYQMSAVLCLEDPSHNYSKDWGMEKLIFRNSRTDIWKDRKYAIQAKNALATGIHMSENAVGPTLHKTESKIRYYHYHNSITVHHELCRTWLPWSSINATTWLDKVPFVYDDTMKKLTPTIKQFERDYIGPIWDN